MKIKVIILSILISGFYFQPISAKEIATDTGIEFYGDTIKFTFDKCAVVEFNDSLSTSSIENFHTKISAANYDSLVRDMVAYKNKRNPDDWVFYQLIRKVAQHISPKEENYRRYTLYKWYLLNKCGYNASLNIAGDKLLLYAQCDETIYDIPFYKRDNKQYVCLNYHDYGHISMSTTKFIEIPAQAAEAVHSFSYQLTQLPAFKPEDYKEKSLEFGYNDMTYSFRIKVNAEVKKIFTNYPVADYQLYFNAPLSSGTYNSLIPQLRKNVKGMSTKNGVDYLMRFTRYALQYEPDEQNFGKEKRLSPEQTLLYEYSDCEDHAALFYYLVKEIYNLPMIVLEYPKHLTIAVKFDKPVGKPIIYNGKTYSVCEPTPQEHDLPLGGISEALSYTAYQIAYAYDPTSKK